MAGKAKKRIVSGGQTGADQAGWRAAKASGIPTGGFMPKGFMTEDGPRPEFAEAYGAVELPTSSDPERTRRNAKDADATVWFGTPAPSGSITTHRACRRSRPPRLRRGRGGQAERRRLLAPVPRLPVAQRGGEPGVEQPQGSASGPSGSCSPSSAGRRRSRRRVVEPAARRLAWRSSG